MEFKNFKIGQKVTIGTDYVENYEVSERDVFYVSHVATSTSEHPGYDEAMEGMPLYDLKDENGDDFGSSLYEYELEEADMNKFEVEIMEKGFLPAVSFPGSYPIFYLGRDNSISCAKCAEENASEIEEHHCHMEGAPLICDGCGAGIPSAYGDPDEEEHDPIAEMHLRLQASEFNDHDETGDLDAYGDPFED